MVEFAIKSFHNIKKENKFIELCRQNNQENFNLMQTLADYSTGLGHFGHIILIKKIGQMVNYMN